MCCRDRKSELILITSWNEANEGKPATGVVGEAADARIADSELAKQVYLLIRIVIVFLHRLIGEQVKTSTAAAPGRLAIWTRSR